MKQIIVILSIIIFASACNNAANEQPVVKLEDIPVQEKELKDAVAKYPDSMLLRKALIKYYEDNQVADRALTAIDNALQKDSTDTDLWDRKAALYIYNEDTSNALKAYNKAIAVFPDPQFVMSAGILYAFKKNDTAVMMADALLLGKKAGAEKEALLIKGIYYSAINEKEKALAFFDECLNLNYTYTSAYLQKGITLFEMGKYEESIKVFTKATTLQNSFAEGYYWMGRCYEKLHNINEAIEQYRTAIFYDKDYVEAKDAMGKLGVK